YQAGANFDDAPVLIVNLASVAAFSLEARMPVDHRRFRANLYVDGLEPEEELGWLGGRIQAGEAELEVSERCVRCGVVNDDPAGAGHRRRFRGLGRVLAGAFPLHRRSRWRSRLSPANGPSSSRTRSTRRASTSRRPRAGSGPWASSWKRSRTRNFPSRGVSSWTCSTARRAPSLSAPPRTRRSATS